MPDYLRTDLVDEWLSEAFGDYQAPPPGGRGNSSFGSREQGRYAVEFYTQVKTAYIAAGVP
jgi:aldehyde dehydrogenase (NAD+)